MSKSWQLRAGIIAFVLSLSLAIGSQPVHADQCWPNGPDRTPATTGFAIDNDTIWNYFNRRGGVNSFGCPTSRTFNFQGFTVQFFQRRIIQLDQNGAPRLLNVLDPENMPYASFNGAVVPAAGLPGASPNPADQAAMLAYVKANVPDTFNGLPVNFYQTFNSTVSAGVAFPTGGDAGLLPGFNLEMWGLPTSPPAFDPNNHNFVYQRFQRGIMHFRADCNCTEGMLLTDYFKDILTKQPSMPGDLAQEAQSNPLLGQYADSPAFTPAPLASPTPTGQPIGSPTSVTPVATPVSLTPIASPITSGNPSPPVGCVFQPTGNLGAALSANPSVAGRLGCATSGGAAIQLAWQSFQNGQLLWRSDTVQIYALLSSGTWSSYPDTYAGETLPPTTPPNGLFAPVRGFGKVWQQQPGLRTQLGWATQAEHGLTGSVQTFANGVGFWATYDQFLGGPSQAVWVVYAAGGWWEPAN